MEQVLKTKDELDVQLAEAIRVRPLERSKCYYFVFSRDAVNARYFTRITSHAKSDLNWRRN